MYAVRCTRNPASTVLRCENSAGCCLSTALDCLLLAARMTSHLAVYCNNAGLHWDHPTRSCMECAFSNVAIVQSKLIGQVFVPNFCASESVMGLDLWAVVGSEMSSSYAVY